MKKNIDNGNELINDKNFNEIESDIAETSTEGTLVESNTEEWVKEEDIQEENQEKDINETNINKENINEDEIISEELSSEEELINDDSIVEDIESKSDIKDNKNDKKLITKCVVASSIASLIISGSMIALNKNNNSGTSRNSTITIENKTVDNVYKAVAQKATPSVVGITTLTINTNNFFNFPMESEGVGSGIIVNSDGYILTNSHVVSDGKASKVSVIFSDATSIDGQVLWNDAKLDLAIVKVDKTGLEVADLGDSSKTEVGDIAIAIGNPLGLEFNKTVTQGIISGLNRTILTENGEMTDLIQTDASINPGNSGGPLFNEKGEVIGINTAKASGAEGLGFAIPINIAKPIIEQVIADGDFQKVTLGVKGFDASQFEMAVKKGVYVIEVEEDSPAKKAGISSGDIIIKVGDKDITNMSDLLKSLYNYKKGDSVKIKLSKDGQEREVKVQF